MAIGTPYRFLHTAHIAIVAVCAVLLLATTQTSAAAPHQAGLLVDYGDGGQTWIWVPFADEHISMMEMLRSSDLDLVTVGFGGLGDAVCQIETTGCGVADCRTRMCQTTSSSPFWRLMRLDGDTWRMTSSGADGTMLGDGEIAAMSWSATTPDMPVVSIDHVANMVGVDPTDPPAAAVTRTINVAGDTSTASRGWLPATGALSVVVVAAGVVVVRGRSMRQAPV